MTDNQTTPDLVSIGAQTLADTGQRLGLMWALRPATVVSSVPLTCLYDGDDKPIGMISLIGYLSIGTRVMAEFVPPSGNYVVGVFTGTDVGRPSHLEYAIATGDTNVTNSEANVPGLTFTVSVASPGARWEAEGTFDFEETALGTTICIGRLYVDGVLQSATALFKVASTNDRSTVGQTWAGTLSASGSHVFQARVVRSLASGTQVANATNTTLKLKVYQ